MKAIASLTLTLCLMTSTNVHANSTNTLQANQLSIPDTTTPGMIVMPVTFVNMRAFENGQYVYIVWSNLTEQNLDHYRVESSTDGTVFKPIDQISVKNNDHQQANYDCYDRSPHQKLNFYRIKAVGLDGEVTYSRALRVEMNSKDRKVTLYPNPVVGRTLSVYLNGLSKGDYQLIIYSKIGTTLLTHDLAFPGGSMTETIDLPASIRQGVFNFYIKGANGFENSQIFIVK